MRKNSFVSDYRSQLIFILLLSSIINYADRVNLSFAIDIRDQFQISATQWGYLLGAWMWPYAIANLPAGWLIDRFGVNRIYFWSLIIWSCATAVGGAMHDYSSLFITRVILGIAEAPFFVVVGKIIQEYFMQESRGRVSSIVNLGPKIASIVTPPIVASIIATFGWRAMMVFFGLIGIILSVAWKKLQVYHNSRLVDNVDIGCTNKACNWGVMRKLLFNRSSIWLNLGNFASSYLFWLYLTWLPTYLMDNRGLNLKQTGWISTIPFIVGTIGVYFGGYLSDLLIRKYKITAIRARLVPTFGGCIISGVTAILINYCDSLTWAIVLFSISTFAVSLRVGVIWALVGDLVPNRFVGTLGGIQNCANFIGGALAPMTAGIILDNTSSYNLIFWISGILVILAGGFYWMIKDPILID